MPTLYQILSQNAGMGGGAYVPGTGQGSTAVPAGTDGYDYGSGTDPGDFWRRISEGYTGGYSNTTKNYLGVGGAGWNPAAASAGYLASQGGPDNPIGFNAWMSGNPQYVAAFGQPPPAGTTFDQFRQGIGKAGPGGWQKDPTLYTPPPGAPGSPGNPVPGTTPGGPMPPTTGGGPPGGAGGGGAYGIDISKYQTPNNNLDVSKYLDPSMAFRLQQGQQTIGNNAAAMGNYQSGSTLKGLEDFSQGLASQEYANAFQRAAQQQGFNEQAFGNAFNRAQQQQAFQYGIDTGDRDFAYKVMTGDRDYNTGVNEFLAQLGMQGAQGASGYQQSLAQAIAGLMGNAGQIQGQGTAAGAGSFANMLQQIMSGLNLNSIMNKIPAPQ